MSVVVGTDGVRRCAWGDGSALYRTYHDHEWGRPVVDDVVLFEKICLEGFQSGLSWITVLRKRERFREVFAGVAEVRDVPFVPFLLEGFAADREMFQNDGIHPTAAAQARILENVWPALAPLLGTTQAAR